MFSPTIILSWLTFTLVKKKYRRFTFSTWVYFLRMKVIVCFLLIYFNYNLSLQLNCRFVFFVSTFMVNYFIFLSYLYVLFLIKELLFEIFIFSMIKLDSSCFLPLHLCVLSPTSSYLLSTPFLFSLIFVYETLRII